MCLFGDMEMADSEFVKSLKEALCVATLKDHKLLFDGIEAHRRMTGEELSPREYLEDLGIEEDDIQAVLDAIKT